MPSQPWRTCVRRPGTSASHHHQSEFRRRRPRHARGHRTPRLAGKLEEAQREAGAAFGRADVFVERFVRRAKHIEVQILGDKHGQLVHLWERDCSVQRRHQKVVEIAPASSAADVRQRICDARSASARRCDTVRRHGGILVDVDRQEFYFIEVNPRIQVEHTVTEMVTGIDLVRTQILIAQGQSSMRRRCRFRGRTQSAPRLWRAVPDHHRRPREHFIPDYGRISTLPSPAVLRCGSTAATVRRRGHHAVLRLAAREDDRRGDRRCDEAVRRADRSLREFRIRGVKTNIAFLGNLILHPNLHFRPGHHGIRGFHAGAVPVPRASRPREQGPLVPWRCHR
jgi:pyruvate carboxylase